MKDWKTNTWWQCQMILCTQTVVVVSLEKTHLWCCVILSTLTCLGQGSFLVRQLLQFGTGVLIRSVLYHSVKYFIWYQIYIFALYYLMIFPLYHIIHLQWLYWCWKDLAGVTFVGKNQGFNTMVSFHQKKSIPPPRFFQVKTVLPSFCKIVPVKHPIRMHHSAWKRACYNMSVTWP